VIRPGIRRLFRLALRRRDIVERDVTDEIRTHLALRTEQLIREGVPPEEARAEAIRRFGPLSEAERVMHHVANERDRTMAFRERLDDFAQDARYALRGLRRQPLFTAFVVATLALGIGANAAMFGVVDRLLIRGPEHITDPDRVMRIYQRVRPTGMDEFAHPQFGYVTYDLLRRQTHSFAGVAAYSINDGGATLGRGAGARALTSGSVTSDLFALLGVHVVLGRFFDAAEDRTSGGEHVAVLGYGLWRSAFGSDRSVLGRTIILSDEPYTIIGVAPSGFTGPQLARVDVWLPMSLRSARVTTNWTTAWDAQWHRIVVRLKPGVTPAQANADADSAEAAASLFVAPISYDGRARETSEIAISRWLMGVAAVVLLIACSNVVNLLLARAVRRRREVAVRLALGAGRARLVRLLLSESMILAALGGIAGLAVAWFTAQMMRSVLLPNVEWVAPPVDARVLLVSAAIALTVGVVVGLVPAIRASRPDLAASLKSGVRDGGGQGNRLRGVLTVAQAALSIVLLVGAGLFVRSLSRVRSLDLGIQPERVLVVEPRWPGMAALDTAARRIERARRADVFPRALVRFRQLAGVARASLTVMTPFQSSAGQFLRVPGWDSIPALKGGGPYVSAVTSEYFETVGTPVLRGRSFTVADRAGSEPVALANETMAKTLWPGRDPLGECLFTGEDRKSATVCARIVGIVGDARRFGLREDPSMHYYLPFGQETGFGGTTLLVRPRLGTPASLVAAARAILQDIDPSISYIQAQTLQESVDPQIRPWRLGASVFGLMGVLALLVAAVGLYSVMSYLVAQRTHELGVRIALGARDGDILSLVLRSSLGMAALGVVLGLGLALALGRFVEPLLFDTSARDPGVFGGVALAMLAVALLASLVPALRARRVNPMEALRAE
jgi:predicted permease